MAQSGRIYDLEEAIRAAHRWMRARDAKPFLSGVFTRGEVVYVGSQTEAAHDREPVAIFTGEVLPLYAADLDDGTVRILLNELASEIGSILDCHSGYWELFPTIDHITPVARGGTNEESNLVTTSMVGNAAKANFTLEELGWKLFPKGDATEWDGLTRWFLDRAQNDPTLNSDDYLRKWFAAASSALR